MLEDTDVSLKFILEIVFAGVLAISLAVLIRVYFFQSFLVPTRSMENTIHANDEILIFKCAYKIKLPFMKKPFVYSKAKRKDVVVFHAPYEEGIYYVKRVVGVSGDRIRIKNGMLYLNGTLLDEEYASLKDEEEEGEYLVKEGYLFVMGDKRGLSEDSRHYGSIKEESVVGRVIVVFSPLKNFSLISRN